MSEPTTIWVPRSALLTTEAEREAGQTCAVHLPLPVSLVPLIGAKQYTGNLNTDLHIDPIAVKVESLRARISMVLPEDFIGARFEFRSPPEPKETA